MRRLSRLAPLIVVVAALNSPILPAQQPLIVRGRVVRADDPAVPLPRVRISLNIAGPSAERVFTDDQGQFEIAVPPSGTTLTASKPGFVTATVPLTRRRPPEPLELPLLRGAAVSGRVIDPSGQLVPLSGVRVRPIDQAPPANRVQLPVSAVTNDRGEYRVGGLAPGRYEVSASFVYDPKEQFESDIAPSALLVVGVPRPVPEAVAVTLQAGEEKFVTLNHREPASTSLPTGGAVTGVVVDDFGEPLQGVRVRLWQSSIADGRRVMTPTSSSHATDDRGQYRAYGVAPGRYFVSVDDPADVISEPGLTADSPVFFPRTVTPAEALEIELGPQLEAAGINVVFGARRQARVRGFVLNAAGRPYRANVTLMAAFHPGEPSMPARAVTSEASTGAFQFENVTPGDYVVRATDGQSAGRGQSPPTPAGALPLSMTRPAITEFGAQRIRVSGEDTPPITVSTSPTSTVVGRIPFDRKPAGIDLLQFAVMAVPDDPDTAPGVRQAVVKVSSPGSNDLTFEITGVVGQVRMVVKAPAPWWLKSVQTWVLGSPDDAFDPVATAGVQDGLTLLLADTAASVFGRVQDDRSAPDDMLILFPTEERLWFTRSPHIKTSQAQTNGRFTIVGIPPGEYFVTAVDLDNNQKTGEWWTDRDVLLALASTAQRITLSEKQSHKANLQPVPAPR